MFAIIALLTIFTLLGGFICQKYLRIWKIGRDIPGAPALPVIGHAHLFFGKKPEEYIMIVGDMMEKYGDTIKIWLGPELNIITSNLKHVETILTNNKFIEKAGMYDLLHPWLNEGLLVSKGKKWFKRRKIITPAFHFKILEEFVDIFDDQSDVLIKILKQFKPDDVVELYPLITLYALDVICGKKWFKRRRIITPAFHFKILQQFVDIFDDQSDALIKSLKQFKPDDVVELYPIISLYALDVICESAMGIKVNAQVNTDSRYVQAVKSISNILHKRVVDVVYRPDFLFNLSNLAKEQKHALKVLHDFSRDVIMSRRDELLQSGQQANADKNDNDIGAKRKLAFLDILLQSEIDGKSLSNSDIQEEVDTFMFEGHDTTTSAINFCFYNLALCPDTQKKCFDEIIDVIGNDPNIPVTYSALNQLHYLELCIKETLRLYPSVPIMARKVVEDTTINGLRIPGGANIAVSPLHMGRTEKIFENANDFIPERFDVVTSAEKMNPYAYIPFSAGARNCIGQKFAMLEIKSIVSKVLRNFELNLCNNEQEPILMGELILRTRNAINFRLKPRIY